MAYIGPAPNPGQNREVDDISSGFNGSEVNFTLQVNSQNVSPGSANAIIVSVGGVVQNAGTDYAVNSSTLTFTTAPASGLSFFGLVLGQGVDAVEPADGSVSTVKIADQAVTNAKVNNSAAIAGTKISPDFGSQAISTTNDSVTIGDSIIHSGDTNTKIRFPAADTIAMESAGSEVFRVTPDEAHGSSHSIRLKSANTVDGASVQTGGTKAYSSGIPRGQVNIMDYQAYNVTDNGGAIAFGARYNSSNAHTTMASIEGVKHNNNDGNYQGAIAFKTRNNSGDNLIRMRLTDNGLCFGTDTAGANALNDYERGTWTVNTSVSSPNQVYSASYVKIGDSVTVAAYITCPTSSDGANFQITSLPFTSKGSANYAIGAAYTQVHTTDNVFVQINPGNNDLYVYKRIGNSVTYSDLSGAYLLFTCTYFTA